LEETVVKHRSYVIFAIAFALVAVSAISKAAETEVQRGKYLVSIIPCTDCHTPGTFLGKSDSKRYLGGSEVGFEVPGLGIFYGPNLTPDDETGLGKWTKEQIATAITTGKRPDGRILAPPMPVESFRNLLRPDALAIAAYLKSLSALKKSPAHLGRVKSRPHSYFKYCRRIRTWQPSLQAEGLHLQNRL